MRKSIFQLLCGFAVLAVITLSFTISGNYFGRGMRFVSAQTDPIGLKGSSIPFTVLRSLMSPKAVGRNGSGLPEGINLSSIAPGTALTVSQASYFGDQIALSSHVTGFGEGLSNVVEGTAFPGRTSLGGVTVRCVDWFGVAGDALITYVDPSQVNFKIPDGLGLGPAQCTFTNTLSGGVSTSNFELVPVKPGIFAANATGSGVPLSTLGRIKQNGAVTYEPTYRVENCLIVPIAIDMGPATDRVYLGMVGTGFRYRSLQPPPTATVGGVSCPITFVGLDPNGNGNDLFQIELPHSLAGRGRVPVVLTVDGVAANEMRIDIR
jgi:uncharacterized protein (TIGR03437 family)